VGNTTGNNLDVYTNTAVSAVCNNVVGNDLKVNNNTAGPQVFSNRIDNNMQCAGNAAQPGTPSRAARIRPRPGRANAPPFRVLRDNGVPAR
jgi:hypothetical protein